MHEKEIEIRWRDCDPYGHVNHAVFLTYLEEVRDEWLIAAVGEDALGYVVARVEIDYRRELTQRDDRITARLRLDSLGTSSVRTVEELVRRGRDRSRRGEGRPRGLRRAAPPATAHRRGARRARACLRRCSARCASGRSSSRTGSSRPRTRRRSSTTICRRRTSSPTTRRAQAAATGLIVLEATAVDPSGLLTPHTLAGYREESTAGFARVAEAVRPHGTRLFVQLFHGGREQIASAPRTPAISASAIPSRRFHVEPRAATAADIEAILDGYARSAANVAAAGLDGIEVSAAHEYLAAQFFTRG